MKELLLRISSRYHPPKSLTSVSLLISESRVEQSKLVIKEGRHYLHFIQQIKVISPFEYFCKPHRYDFISVAKIGLVFHNFQKKTTKIVGKCYSESFLPTGTRNNCSAFVLVHILNIRPYCILPSVLCTACKRLPYTRQSYLNATSCDVITRQRVLPACHQSIDNVYSSLDKIFRKWKHFWCIF